MSAGYKYGTQSITNLLLLRKNNQLNLDPAFQRQSVWSLGDRRRLIESLLERRPLPSVFLYKRQGYGGKVVYDVIDGKQRLESVFMFMGTGGFAATKRFEVKRFDSNGSPEWVSWDRLASHEKNLLRSTELQTVEIDWDLGDVIDLFVRINSTGKRLTGAEKLNAKFMHSDFLVTAKKLAEQNEPFFKKHRVFSPGQLTRMKHVEFVAELLASLHAGGPINKKRELDRLIAGGTISAQTLASARTDFVTTLKRIETIFPTLGQTRMRTSTELYSLVLLIHRMSECGYVFGQKSRNEMAQQMLVNFGVGVDTVSERIKGGKGARADQALYLDYLNTVRSDTDSQKSRKKRQRILEDVLAGIFEPKHCTRAFSPAQRRILWHSSAERKCAIPGCPTKLTWDDFTVDHVRPHAKGGLTDLSNAQLMCRKHNSAKGAQ